MSPPHSDFTDFMQREEPSMEDITTSDDNNKTTKRKLKQTKLNF